MELGLYAVEAMSRGIWDLARLIDAQASLDPEKGDEGREFACNSAISFFTHREKLTFPGSSYMSLTLASRTYKQTWGVMPDSVAICIRRFAECPFEKLRMLPVSMLTRAIYEGVSHRGAEKLDESTWRWLVYVSGAAPQPPLGVDRAVMKRYEYLEGYSRIAENRAAATDMRTPAYHSAEGRRAVCERAFGKKEASGKLGKKFPRLLHKLGRLYGARSAAMWHQEVHELRAKGIRDRVAELSRAASLWFDDIAAASEENMQQRETPARSRTKRKHPGGRSRRGPKKQR